jgi:zinc protease
MRFTAVLSLAAALLLTAAGSAPAATPYAERVREHVLANGLQVLLLEDHRAPVASFQVWYRVGSRNEDLGRTGLAHVLEHMMFKGTATMGPEDYSNTIKRNGGDENAFTTADSTTYFAQLASDRLHVAIELEADRMANLAFAEEQFLPELKVVMEERRMRTADQPVGELFEQMRATAYTAHPYGWPVIGWMNDLRQLAREDALAFYRTHYSPANAIAIVVGDFDSDDVLAKIEAAFGAIPAGRPAPVVRAIEPPQQGERRTVLRRPAELPFVALAFHVPSGASDDAYALDVLADLLAGGKSSRLHQDLVYQRRIARSAGASYDMTSIDPGLFLLHAQPMPGVAVETVEKALLEHLERLRTEPPSPAELDKVKRSSAASLVFAQDSQFYQGMLLGEFAITGDWRKLDALLPGIQAVTGEDIQRVARKYFDADNRTVGILDPS